MCSKSFFLFKGNFDLLCISYDSPAIGILCGRSNVKFNETTRFSMVTTILIMLQHDLATAYTNSSTFYSKYSDKITQTNATSSTGISSSCPFRYRFQRHKQSFHNSYDKCHNCIESCWCKIDRCCRFGLEQEQEPKLPKVEEEAVM